MAGVLVEVQAARKPETDVGLADGRLNSNGVDLDSRIRGNDKVAGKQTIEVMIKCRLTYEQLAELMRQGHISNQDISDQEISHKGDK